MSSEYQPLRSWHFGALTVSESDKPDAVVVGGVRLTRAQFKALAEIADDHRVYGDYVCYAKAPEVDLEFQDWRQAFAQEFGREPPKWLQEYVQKVTQQEAPE